MSGSPPFTDEERGLYDQVVAAYLAECGATGFDEDNARAAAEKARAMIAQRRRDMGSE